MDITKLKVSRWPQGVNLAFGGDLRGDREAEEVGGPVSEEENRPVRSTMSILPYWESTMNGSVTG